MLYVICDASNSALSTGLLLMFPSLCLKGAIKSGNRGLTTVHYSARLAMKGLRCTNIILEIFHRFLPLLPQVRAQVATVPLRGQEEHRAAQEQGPVAGADGLPHRAGESQQGVPTVVHQPATQLYHIAAFLDTTRTALPHSFF